MTEASLSASSKPQTLPTERAERVEGFLKRHKTWIAGAMCCFAALRILIFAAAYPLFNSVDEQDHYEMVYRYAHGFSPGKTLPLSDPEMARVFTLYGSPEYLTPRAILQRAQMDVPIAKLPPERKEVAYGKVFRYWTSVADIEAQSPPAYYMVASVWYRFGALLGMKDWALAYFVRFLNAGLYAAFIGIAFLFVEEVAPGNIFLSLAVPILLAFFPQDVLFGINRDILSPLLAALVLLLLFRGMRKDQDWRGNLIIGGSLAGIAFLTDVSNFVLFGALAVVLVVALVRSRREGNGRGDLAVIFGAGFAAILPPILWMARNKLLMGDLTGSKAKTAYLGWTLQPWHELWRHPIFTAKGAAFFFSHLTTMFWRGEYVWQGAPTLWSVSDGFYVASSGILLAAFLVYLSRSGRTEKGAERLAEYLSLYLVLASVLFLAVISLLFDFHECFYPSRAYPYFVSGRIIDGALLPFALIYIMGFEYLWRPIRKFVHPVFGLVAIGVFVTWAEICVRLPVFSSNFNFFALRGM